VQETTDLEQLKEKLIQHLKAEFASLESSRHNWESMWQDIGELTIPARADFNTQRAKGENRRNRIFESTPVRSLTRFASGLHNMLVPSTIPWFIITTQNRQAAKDRDISLYLEELQRYVQDAFNTPSNNFHPAIHEYMQDMGAFGTAVMMVVDRPGEGPYYMTIPLYDCYLAINDLGRVDTLYRLYEHTAKELLDAYGPEALPESVINALEKNNAFKRFECVNVIKPSNISMFLFLSTCLMSLSSGSKARTRSFRSKDLWNSHLYAPDGIETQWRRMAEVQEWKHWQISRCLMRWRRRFLKHFRKQLIHHSWFLMTDLSHQSEQHLEESTTSVQE